MAFDTLRSIIKTILWGHATVGGWRTDGRISDTKYKDLGVNNLKVVGTDLV